jgi:hypothetical protein
MKTREEQLKYNKKYYEDNRVEHAERRRDYNLKQHFGISSEEYDIMFAAHEGVCAICREKCPTGKRLCVDHNSETGEVRGLLCVKCNRALGGFNEDERRLLAAIAYLRVYQGS